MKKRLSVFLLFISMTLTFGQKGEFLWQQYTKLDGLSTNEIYDLIQGDEGYLYIASDNGLMRFNGREFFTLKSEKGDQPSCSQLHKTSDNRIFSIAFDGRIFEIRGDSIITFMEFQTNFGSFPTMHIDKDDGMWIGMFPKIYHKRKNAQIFDTLHVDRLLGDISTLNYNIYYADYDKVIFAGNYLYVYDRANNALVKILDYDADFYMSEMNDRLIFSARELKSKENTYYEILNIEKDEFDLQRLNLIHKKDLRIVSINFFDDTYWLCTNKGLYYSRDLETYEKLFTNSTISKVFKDNEGQIWVSTTSKGVFVCRDPFLKRVIQAKVDKEVYALGKHQKNLWVGYKDGLIQSIDSNGNELITLKLSRDEVVDIEFIPPYINVGTSDGFHVIDPKTGKSAMFAFGFIKAMEFRDDSSIVLGTSTNYGSFFPNIIDENADGRTIYNEIGEGLDFFNHGLWLEYDKKRARDIKVNGDTIYLALANETLIRSNISLIEVKDENDNSIQCFAIEKVDEEIWLATSRGILGMNKGLIQWVLDANDGLSDQKVLGLKALGNIVWVWTNKGIQAIDANNRKILYNLEYHDGVVFDQVKDLEFLGNKLLIGATSGLYQMPQDYYPNNKYSPILKIQSILVNDIPESKSGNLILEFDYGEMSIDLESISLKSADAIRIFYRLTEDENFRPLEGNDQTIRLSSLSEGNYQLEAFAVNEDGIRSETIKKDFKVLAPFYRTLAFYALMILIILIVGFTIFKIRINTIKRNLDLQKKIVQSELKALQSQMNPHFVFNALNSIQDLILQKDMRNANDYLVKFSKLMRMVLNASENGKVQLEEEIEMLQLYLQLEELRFGEEFNWEIKIQNGLDQFLEIPSMIIQPHVENAIKHGLFHKSGIKQLVIDFGEEEDQVIIRIEDNGIGREKSEEKKKQRQYETKSFSTRANEKRVDLLNQSEDQEIKIEIEDLLQNGEASGTRVSITFPK